MNVRRSIILGGSALVVVAAVVVYLVTRGNDADPGDATPQAGASAGTTAPKVTVPTCQAADKVVLAASGTAADQTVIVRVCAPTNLGRHYWLVRVDGQPTAASGAAYYPVSDVAKLPTTAPGDGPTVKLYRNKGDGKGCYQVYSTPENLQSELTGKAGAKSSYRTSRATPPSGLTAASTCAAAPA